MDTNSKSLEDEIKGKTALLSSIVAAKFGQGTTVSDGLGVTAGVEKNNIVEDDKMRVTRSASSGAPGEVVDGKLVNPKELLSASAAARSEIPPTDLLALAKANDPHNDTSLPEVAAAAIPARTAANGGPGFKTVDTPDNGLGNIPAAVKESLHSKQHEPILNAVETPVEKQTATGDQYKTLHASDEVSSVVARAKAILAGARELKAATEDAPGAGKPEPGEGIPAGADAGKNPQQSAETLTARKAALAKVQAAVAARRQAAHEGMPVDPIGKGEDAAKDPADIAKSWGTEKLPKHVMEAAVAAVAMLRVAFPDPKKATTDEASGYISGKIEKLMDEGKEQQQAVAIAHNMAREKGYDVPEAKAAAGGATKTAENKDRPLPSMPEGKPRYKADDDKRDEQAESYWAKNKKDEARYTKEWGEERPLTRDLASRFPKLSPQAALKAELVTRLAGLEFVAEMSDDEASRLRSKSVRYPKDKTPEDMDFAGAAKRTQSEISSEHKARENDSHIFSPMMSRLWSAALGMERTAGQEPGKLPAPTDTALTTPAEAKTRLKAQIAELKKALAGVKADDKAAPQQLAVIQDRLSGMEAELSRSAAVKLGGTAIDAIAGSVDSLFDFADFLRAASLGLASHHAELRFAADKAPAGPSADKARKLLEDLGETAEDMAAEIEDFLKGMGVEKKKKGPKDEKKGPEKPPKDELEGNPEGKPAGMEKEMPLGGEMPGPLPGEGMPPMPMANLTGPFKTASEEEAAVSVILSDTVAKPEDKAAKVAAIRKQAQWHAVFTKVAGKDGKTADIEGSYWTVRRGEEITLRAAVRDLYPVEQAEKLAAYNWCSTADYGRKLLAQVKGSGVEKTAQMLGIVPMVKAASLAHSAQQPRPKIDEAGYYKGVYPASYVTELLKNHEKKASDALGLVEKKANDIAAENATLKAKLAQQDDDIALHARAEKAIAVVALGIEKGIIALAKRQEFVDRAMVMDDNGFDAFAHMVAGVETARTAAPVDGAKPPLTAKDLIKAASAGPGLKSAVLLAATEKSSGVGDLQANLQSIWKQPPVAR